MSCSLDMTQCSSISGLVLSRYTYNSGTKNYDKTGDTTLTCSGCSFTANYMSDDGSYHVLYTDNDKFMVFSHSGGSLTYESENNTMPIQKHNLQTYQSMYRDLKGSSLVISPPSNSPFSWHDYDAGTKSYVFNYSIQVQSW